MRARVPCLVPRAPPKLTRAEPGGSIQTSGHAPKAWNSPLSPRGWKGRTCAERYRPVFELAHDAGLTHNVPQRRHGRFCDGVRSTRGSVWSSCQSSCTCTCQPGMRTRYDECARRISMGKVTITLSWQAAQSNTRRRLGFLLGMTGVCLAALGLGVTSHRIGPPCRTRTLGTMQRSGRLKRCAQR